MGSVVELVCVAEPAPTGGTVCRIGGEIDLCTADQLWRALVDAVTAHGCPLVVDLSRVTFMDLSGVDVLLRVDACLTAAGSPGLRINGPTRAVSRVLLLSGATSVLSGPTS